MRIKNKLHNKRSQSEKLLIGEIQLLLAEKRTYFSLLRTGIAIFTFPLTVIAFLGATSQYHQLFSSFWGGAILVGTLLFISVIGLILFFRAERRVKQLNQLVLNMRKKNKRLTEIIVL
ncbi:MAG: DUF202 domain-containing protein [bacterium]|nr:DUF202 domain-containing protein [bacterium]